MSTLKNGLGGPAGFGENFLPRNDDGSSGFIDITSVFESGLNFFGQIYNGFYVNNNGNITFGKPLGEYQPFSLTGNTSIPIIAAFFTDIDTRAGALTPSPGGNSTGSNLVYWHLDPVTDTVTITWDDVGEYSYGTTPNAFQIILQDKGGGDFGLEFIYEKIQWNRGNARAGYSAADGVNFYEFPQSGTSEMLNLETASNTVEQEGFVFSVVEGNPTQPPTDIQLSQLSIDENSPNGTAIGTLTTTDPDEGDTHNYTLVDDAEGRFAINGNQLVVANASLLDFEANNQHQITIRTQDAAGLGYQKSFTVTVNDVPEPDLLATNIVVATEVIAGQQVEVAWTIANQGDAATTGPWVDRVYLTDDPASDHKRLIGEFIFSGILAAGESVERRQTLSVPEELTGSYHIIVVSDADNQILESNSEGTGESNNTTVGERPIAVNPVPLPNLQVLPNIAVPATAFSNQETVIQWQVFNSGTAATSTPTWYDSVWLSQDRVLDETDQLLGQVHNASYLNVGDSYTNSLAFRLPQNLQGNYYFLVETDNTNQVTELSEEDNRAVSGPMQVQLTPPPDLQVSVVNAPFTAFSGQNMALNWTVVNRGTGQTPAAEANWSDKIYLSADTVLDDSDIELTQVTHSGILHPGESYNASHTVNLPIGNAGNYYFLVKTDANEQVFEHAFENNNISFDATPTHINLTPPPDLEVSSLETPPEALAGHDLTINYRVTNSGSSATPNRTWTDSFYLSEDDQLDPNTDLLLGEKNHYGALEREAEYNHSVAFTLPNEISGTYYPFVVTDSGNSVFELNNDNNTYSNGAPITISSRPADLIVAGASIPEVVEAGQESRVNWTVTNQGSGDTAVTAWTDKIFASQDAVLGNGDDIFLGSFQRRELLNAGESYSRSELVSIPLQMTGAYNLFVATDTDERVYEADGEENNSLLAQEFTVNRETADLQVDRVDISAAQALGGEPFTVSWTVQNSGPKRTNRNYWYDEIYLSRDLSLSEDDVRLGRVRHTNPLEPGEQYETTKTFTLPIHLDGEFNVLVRTNSDDSVIENLRDNNEGVAAARLSLTPNPNVNLDEIRSELDPASLPPELLPDLNLTGVTVPAEGLSGQSVELTWTVRNDGYNTGDASWRDVFYLSRDAVFDRNSDTYLGYVQHNSGLAAGEEYTKTQSFTIPKGLSGQFYVFAVTDSADRVYERDEESNNIVNSATPIQVTLPPPADLVVSRVEMPQTGIAGQQTTISYTVTNQGTNPALGSWEDSIYLSADDQWDAEDIFVGTVKHRGDVAGGESYTESLTASLPGAVPGNYRVIVRTDVRNVVREDNENNNASASPGQMAMDIPVLQLGGAANGNLGQGQSVYYRLDVAEGETMLVKFDSTSETAANELYLSYGKMPSRSQFDYKFSKAFAPDQQITVPLTEAGTYYLLAYGNTVPEAAAYTLEARTLDFELLDITPDAGSNQGQVTLTLDGSKFSDNVEVSLVAADGSELSASRIRWKDSTTLWATFNLQGQAIGQYEVRLADDGEIAALEDAFTVTNDPAGNLEISVNAPNFIREGRQGMVTVNYANNGGSDIPAPLLDLSLTNGQMRQPGAEEFDESNASFLGINFDGPAGTIPPGATGSFSIPFKPTVPEGAIEFVASQLVPKNNDTNNVMRLPSWTNRDSEPTSNNQSNNEDDLIDKIWKQVEGKNGTYRVAFGNRLYALGIEAMWSTGANETSTKLAAEGRNIANRAYRLFSGELLVAYVRDFCIDLVKSLSPVTTVANQLYDFFFSNLNAPEKSPTGLVQNFSGGTTQGTFTDLIAGMADADTFARGILGEDYPELSADPNNPNATDKTNVIRSFDPNDIIGPAGFGEEGWIAANETLPYTIRFENEADATGSAQQVKITQQLDPDLDWRTFRVGDFGWSDLYLQVPENQSFYYQRLDLQETHGFSVDVTAGIDIAKGEAFWTLTTVDPATGDIPEDALLGFLPPNTEEGIGEGFVNYTIRPKRDAQTGDVIDAEATIVFDTNEPIDTPPIFNTLDAGVPTSAVVALPEMTETGEFLVSWSGSDDPEGSAIASFTIYVSDNGGEFTPWLENTTLTESTFMGEPGHTYTFYSIAQDNAGNIEAAPSEADATITIINSGVATTLQDSFTVAEDTSLTIAAADLVSNDINPQNLALTPVLASQPTNGTVTANPDGSFTYTPNPDFNGEDAFIYKVIDSNGVESNESTVAINVTPVNDLPVVVDDTATTLVNTPLTIPVEKLLANDSDPEGERLVLNAVDNAIHGTVSIEDGEVVFIPDADFVGEATFEYSVRDIHQATQTGTVVVTVNAIPTEGSGTSLADSESHDSPDSESHSSPDSESHGSPDSESHGSPDSESHGSPDSESHGSPDSESHGSPDNEADSDTNEDIWGSIPDHIVNSTSVSDLSWGDEPYILWRNYQTGENQVWFMNDTEKIASAELPSMSDTTWRLMGQAKFDGDDYADLLWRNSQTGENQIWLMEETEENGIAQREIVELPGRDPNWQLRGIGDINGDGNADIFWHHLYSGQNQVWLMNDTQRTFTLDLPSMYDTDYMVDTDWDLRGTGDFNNDNRPDLLWRNTVTGANQIWLMSGLEQTQIVDLPATTDVNWRLMGTHDLNGDGSSDLLWHNINTKDNQVWLMNGTSRDEVVNLPNSEGWEMVLSNFLQGNPVEGEAQVDQEPPITLIPELNHVANLTTSVGDGGLNITVEATGSFGSFVNPLTYTYYDPVGSIHEASTTYQSCLAIRIGDTEERTFLTPENTQVAVASNQSDFTATSPNSIYSEFTYGGLEFNLEQSVGKLFQNSQRTGSFLTQTYTITNLGSETVNFDLIRYLDGDLQFDGSIQDGGGRLVRDGQQILFETDAGGDPLESTTFMGITADGGTELEGNFEINEYWTLRERILNGEPLANVIVGDGDDDDEFVDEGSEYDLALALGNGFELAPGESTTYTTTTIFGSGSPETSITENDGSLILQLADTATEPSQSETGSQLPITGTANSDVLTGTDGDDVLSGVDANAEIPGLGEIDTLTGGEGSDVFVLGDSARFYYNDGDDAATGEGDYALITDFNVNEDFIQLHGEPTDYQFGNVPEGLPEGTAIFKTTADANELIGIVQNHSHLTVDGDYLIFV